MTVWMPPEWVGGSGAPPSPEGAPESIVPPPRGTEPEPEAPARGARQPYSWFSPPRAPETAADAPVGSVFSDTVSTTSSRDPHRDAPAGPTDCP